MAFFIRYLPIAFLLNLLWEMGQAGLYQPHFEGVSGFILVHLKAVLGDVVIIFTIYLATALILRSRKINTIFLLLSALLGFIFAVIIEKYALGVGRWSYNELMPIIPLLEVGLTPILQLTIIAPLTFFLTIKKPAFFLK